MNITARNGSATSANCLSSTAAPSRTAAQTQRERAASAKASTRQRRLGASAVPNHAALIASGFAASAAPRREPPRERAAEEQRGREQRERGEQHEEPVVVERGGQQAARRRRSAPCRGSTRSGRERPVAGRLPPPPGTSARARCPGSRDRTGCRRRGRGRRRCSIWYVESFTWYQGSVASRSPTCSRAAGTTSSATTTRTERDRPAAAQAIGTPDDGARERDEERRRAWRPSAERRDPTPRRPRGRAARARRAGRPPSGANGHASVPRSGTATIVSTPSVPSERPDGRARRSSSGEGRFGRRRDCRNLLGRRSCETR